LLRTHYTHVKKVLEEKFEDTKGVIRSCKLKDRQHNDQTKTKIKRQTTIYKILHRKIKIEQHESQQQSVVNSCTLEGKAVPAHVAPIMLLL